jgi:hypothetical protein
MPADSIRSTLERALDAYDGLADLGGSIDDEWSYVNDLSEAWRERLEVVVDARGDAPAAPDVAAAVDRAIDEIGLITDPHRAIACLSTFRRSSSSRSASRCEFQDAPARGGRLRGRAGGPAGGPCGGPPRRRHAGPARPRTRGHEW